MEDTRSNIERQTLGALMMLCCAVTLAALLAICYAAGLIVGDGPAKHLRNKGGLVAGTPFTHEEDK